MSSLTSKLEIQAYALAQDGAVETAKLLESLSVLGESKRLISQLYIHASLGSQTEFLDEAYRSLATIFNTISVGLKLREYLSNDADQSAPSSPRLC